MATATSYKVRHGNAVPVMNGSTMKDAFVWTFGAETQDIDSCESTTDILSSKDMCMLGGDYFSAQYKAHPGKVDGDLVFNVVLAFKPKYIAGENPPTNSTPICDF